MFSTITYVIDNFDYSLIKIVIITITEYWYQLFGHSCHDKQCQISAKICC
jgi:hypothetical protein